MKRVDISIPQLGLIAGTRGMLGAGLALLLADKLTPDKRRAVGWTLAIVGAVSTIPLAMQILSSRHEENGRAQLPKPAEHEAGSRRHN